MAIDSATTLAIADTAHTAAAEHASSGLPQFDPTSFTSQLFWLAIVFVVLYTYFAKSGLPKVGKTIEVRNDQIQSDRNSAESMTREAQDVMEAYEKSLVAARHNSAKLHAENAEAIKGQVDKALQAFKTKADDQIKATEKSLADSKHQVMDEMHTIAAEIASAAAEKIVGISTDINAAKSVVQSVNSKLSKAA
jgi:F-type H+-transporting ATPase subunit b